MGQEPVRAWATARYEYGVDLETSGVLWFADGAIASFDCGFVHPMRQWLEIVGENGTIHVPEMWVPASRPEFELRRDGSAIERTGAAGDQIQCMLENFSHYVLDGAPVHPAPDEAVKTLRVLDALARSAREGRIVDV
jgi:predicted dehydrogenase